MPPRPHWKIQCHVVIGPIQGGSLSSGNFLQIGPLQWLEGIISLLGNVGLEETRVVGRGGIKTAHSLTGNNLRSWPIGPSKVQSGIFRQTHPWELTVRNNRRVVIIGSLTANFHPIIEWLGSRHRYRVFCCSGKRCFWVLKEDLIGSADWISHRSVAESSDSTEEKICE